MGELTPTPISGIDEWSTLCSQSYVPLTTDADTGFRGALRSCTLDEIGISQVGSTRAIIRRGAHLARTEPRETAILSIMLSGSAQIRHSDRAREARRGTAYLLDSDQPYEVEFPERYDMLALVLPARAIRASDAARRALAGQPMRPSVPLQVLRNHLARLVEGEHRARPAPDHEAAEAAVVLELLQATFDTIAQPHRSPAPLSRGSTLAHARWFLFHHQADPRLTIDVVAERLHISRRHLENHFTLHGIGPASYLRHLRTRRAAVLLSRNPDVPVAEIGRRAGFTDTNTFIRAFRRDFGSTPAAWRRTSPSRACGSLLSPLPGVLRPPA